ncbi:MAG: histidine--tRNA ligase [Chitinispirillaceae bacterium]
MAVPQGPKGTRDLYPEEMAFQQFIFDSWHRTCRKYGFEQYEGPMFEHLELYTQKSGEEIEKQLYAFQDKGGRNIALRPELTPTLARMVATKGTNLKRPVRWYSIPRLFRYERMQKGRLREFIQLNMDILGIDNVSADAELIAASIEMMKDLGFSEDDFKVRISSRTLLEELFVSFGVTKEALASLYTLLDRKSKMPPDVFAQEMENLIPSEQTREKVNGVFSAENLEDIEKLGGADLPAYVELKELFSLLDTYNLSRFILFDVGIVRGLAYYTGIVFELFDVKQSLRAIAGGGRYDKLVSLYGGPPTPAVGFAAGDVVLGELLKKKGIIPPRPPRSDLFLISIDNDSYPQTIKTAQNFRSSGIACEFSLKKSTNIGKQLKNANAARARFALFIGGEEAIQGKMKLKDLGSGQEELIAENEISDILLKKLKGGCC